jgi:putative selenate reductase
MGDTMRSVPFRELIERIFGEYKASGSIFGIPEGLFFRKKGNKTITFAGETCATPVGPAAGPHTQLAGNLITAYLAGGRFFELKTVQKLDKLELEKPCIEAEDEAYNTEWSTELTVRKAYHEYVKAWIVMHLLEELFSLSGAAGGRQLPAAFNMSVGYDLAGIQLPKMDTFINDLIDASKSKYFNQCLEDLEALITENAAGSGGLFDVPGRVREVALDGLPGRIPRRVCSSLTISTLHGCPPEEIQSIAEYIIREKQLATLVKLNPTLLGFDRARELLDAAGFYHIRVTEETFSNDLLYGDALPMLKSLHQTAEKNGVTFGVKLSNTLPSVNEKGVLPGDEMYMSGRALYPLTVNLAADLAEDLNGRLPISFCGGLTSLNIASVFQAGLRPLTMATDLLKPGGYLRMKAAADLLEGLDSWDFGGIQPEMLAELADRAPGEPFTRRARGDYGKALISRRLPLFDCYAAPCVEACPIGQDVPAYIRLVGDGKYTEALRLIYEKNPLPSITGTICDHQCMYRCTRLDYEGAVRIREMKLQAAVKGYKDFRASAPPAGEGGKKRGKAAVVGAGPAGLAAAFFLSRHGFAVTVMDKEQSAGGVVRNILPKFRLPEEAVLRDIAFIQSRGVRFEFGIDGTITLADLRTRGFDTVFLAVGAEKANELDLPGGGRVLESLEFLRSLRAGDNRTPLGKRVAVIGGGNTAMDSARAAVREPGVEEVYVCYRRSEGEMPADREEYENALDDGVVFQFLLQPEEFNNNGVLRCRVMELGEPDASGRKRPAATDKVRELQADTVISAVGEHADADFLRGFGAPFDGTGNREADPGVYIIGDARTGPSTVVECIADARKAADAADASAGMKAGAAVPVISAVDSTPDGRAAAYGGPRELRDDLALRKVLVGVLPVENGGNGKGRDLEEQEKRRCLECDLLCNKCVEVCPNRANIAVETPEGLGLENVFQIVHIDAYCNECGSCGTFCPYDGKPYLDKITVFSLPEDFEGSENTGVYLWKGSGMYRLDGVSGELGTDGGGMVLLKDNGGLSGDGPRTKQFIRFINYLYRDHAYLFGRVEH